MGEQPNSAGPWRLMRPCRAPPWLGSCGATGTSNPEARRRRLRGATIVSTLNIFSDRDQSSERCLLSSVESVPVVVFVPSERHARELTWPPTGTDSEWRAVTSPVPFLRKPRLRGHAPAPHRARRWDAVAGCRLRSTTRPQSDPIVFRADRVPVGYSGGAPRRPRGAGASSDSLPHPPHGPVAGAGFRRRGRSEGSAEPRSSDPRTGRTDREPSPGHPRWRLRSAAWRGRHPGFPR